MTSLLIITPVDKLQDNINKKIKENDAKLVVFISLNKTQKSTEETFLKEKINIEKIFFIDCVTSEKTKEEVLHIKPDNLDMLSEAISEFIDNIPGEKLVIIDALSTLLIYNSENKVAQFIKNITSFASRKNTEIIAFSPETQGEELLEKIYNFFDKVEKNKDK
ncbi:MAG: DUF835 domain-containing protein [Candidatus Woesearchaeota archaeon]